MTSIRKTTRDPPSMFDVLYTDGQTRETITSTYDKWANIYDREMFAVNYQLHNYLTTAVLKYTSGSPSNLRVLDVGSGTGLVGEKLYANGIRHIDGVDPSNASIGIASKKGIYRQFYCDFFTKEPLNIASNTYDVIVSGGGMLRGHLPYDCLCEMIRLVKPGGIICIVSRESSFDNVTVPEYKDRLVPLMKDLETTGKWKKIVWEKIPQYISTVKGLLIVYEVL